MISFLKDTIVRWESNAQEHGKILSDFIEIWNVFISCHAWSAARTRIPRDPRMSIRENALQLFLDLFYEEILVDE